MSGSISSLRRSASSRASRSATSRGSSCGDGGARELPPDHRGALEHGALLGPQPLDARGEQRVDRRRHLERRELDAGGPAVALPLERAVVDQHAHQLADEERIALAGGEHAPGDRGRQLVGADHVRGEPRRRAGVEAGERHDVGDEAAGRRERRARVAQLGPRRRRARAAARRCPTAPGARSDRAAAAPPTGGRRSRAPPAAPRRARRAGGGRRRRSPRATPACRRAARRCRRRSGARSASSPGSAASIAARSASPPAPSSMPRSARSASASGAKVAPPAASQCAVSTVAASPSRRANSSIRRDLPRPGEPRTTARRARGRRDGRVVDRA